MIGIDSYDFREVANGIWLWLNVAMSIVLWRHVFFKVRTEPSWYHSQGTQAAIALAFYFTGSTIMRSWVWILLLLERRGDDQAFIGDHVEVPLVAAALAITGSLCCVRVFSPGPWGRWFWIATGVLSITIPIAVHFAV